MIQNLIVALLVAAALLYLGRKAWRRWKGRDCGCEHCPAADRPDHRPK